MAINPNRERPFYDEEVKLCKGWAATDGEIDISDYVHEHGTPEYIEYYDREIEELEELDRKYPDMMW